MEIYNDIAAAKAAGKKIIGCFPLYPPLELFDAMGLAPVVLWGFSEEMKSTTKSDGHLQNYVCSVARRMTEFVLSESGRMLDGLFMYNACDTLRNLPEILESGCQEAGRPVNIHRIHLPVTCDGRAGDTDICRYMENEMAGLIRQLEASYGVSFSQERFKESTMRYEEIRSLCRDLDRAAGAGRMPFADFVRAVDRSRWMQPADQSAFLQTAADEEAKAGENRQDSACRVIISGILPPPAEVFAIMEGAGLSIAGNDIASLYRSYGHMPAPDTEPGRYYNTFYRKHFPCPTLLHTADRRPQALMELVREKGASGVVFIGEKFCEYEYFEFPYLEKKLKAEGIPVLQLEIAMADGSAASLRTRIEAFAEMLKGGEKRRN